MAWTAKKRKAKIWTKEAILADWQKALASGLGKKKLDPSIAAQFGPPLLVKIQARILIGADYNKEGAGTRAVAKTLGQICKMLTAGSTVSLAVFELAFKLCKLHPKCPSGGGGGGQWCDI
jgi:hypothetical protein